MSILQDWFHLCGVGSLVQGGTDTLVYFFIGNVGRLPFFFPAFAFFDFSVHERLRKKSDS